MGHASSRAAARGVLACAAIAFLFPPLSATAGEAAAPVRIAVAPMSSPEETVIVYRDLMEYLTSRLGRPVQMMQRRSYQEVIDLLGTGQLEAAILCAGTYVHAQRQYGVKLLAVPVANGNPSYRSYIIAREHGGIDSFEALRGHRFAFTDPLSATGFLYPLYLLLAERANPRAFFSNLLFTYGHDNSIEAVAEGVADGAAVNSLVYDHLRSNDPHLVAGTRVIHRSPAFGAPPVAVPRILPLDLKRRLQEAFVGLNADRRGREILRRLGLDRYILGDDHMYDGVRRMLLAVERETRR